MNFVILFFSGMYLGGAIEKFIYGIIHHKGVLSGEAFTSKAISYKGGRYSGSQDMGN